jgi:dUTP pyrophosphatase
MVSLVCRLQTWDHNQKRLKTRVWCLVSKTWSCTMENQNTCTPNTPGTPGTPGKSTNTGNASGEHVEPNQLDNPSGVLQLHSPTQGDLYDNAKPKVTTFSPAPQQPWRSTSWADLGYHVVGDSVTTATSRVRVVRLEHCCEIPRYATPGSSGMDLASTTDLVLLAGQRALIPIGICIELPRFHEAQIRSRSGLASKHGVVVLNSPGTIDEDYRGEISVCLANLSDQPYKVLRGMRIAQMVISTYRQVMLDVVDQLSSTARTGGFGSTGV